MADEGQCPTGAGSPRGGSEPASAAGRGVRLKDNPPGRWTEMFITEFLYREELKMHSCIQRASKQSEAASYPVCVFVRSS